MDGWTTTFHGPLATSPKSGPPPQLVGVTTERADIQIQNEGGDEETGQAGFGERLPAHLRQPIESSPRARIDPSRPPIMEVRTVQGSYYGVPIGWFSDQSLLMRNDGAIQFLDTPSILERNRLDDGFRPIEPSVLMSQLRREFGGGYHVRYEPPYILVAQPSGMESWSQRFKSFQHSLQLYCATTGIPLRAPEFPLIAIVLANQAEFASYSRSVQNEMPKNCAGYYSQKTNRIVLFQSQSQDESSTLETICHEATHQLAFNLGIHQRMSEAPLWLVEGLAMMFEGKRFSDLRQRDTSTYWPSSQTPIWRRLAREPATVKRIVDRLVRSDDPFKTDTAEAYAVAWGMSIYLSQRMKPQFTQYVRRAGALPPFQTYPASERMSDFFKAFGSDTGMLTRNLMQHVENLP